MKPEKLINTFIALLLVNALLTVSAFAVDLEETMTVVGSTENHEILTEVMQNVDMPINSAKGDNNNNNNNVMSTKTHSKHMLTEGNVDTTTHMHQQPSENMDQIVGMHNGVITTKEDRNHMADSNMDMMGNKMNDNESMMGNGGMKNNTSMNDSGMSSADGSMMSDHMTAEVSEDIQKNEPQEEIESVSKGADTLHAGDREQMNNYIDKGSDHNNEGQGMMTSGMGK